MKTLSQLRSCIFPAACALLVLTALTSCELPPRDVWRIVQRDGLFNYWSGNYQLYGSPNRYAAQGGSPFVMRSYNGVPYRPRYLGGTEVPYRPRYLGGTEVPYRPRYLENRYMGSSEVPYRPRRTVTRSEPSPRSSSRSPRPSRSKVADTQDSKILLEAPKTTAAPTSPVTPPATAPKPSMESLPYGIAIPGRPGMVNSPFAAKQQLVDVTGMAPGEAVKDPYSGKLFRVPPTQQAAAENTAPAAPEPPQAPEPAKEVPKSRP